MTTVYVTHDQVEAMTLGQRVCVLRDGMLQQVDTPQNLYDHPVNLFVGGFIGSPSMNLVTAKIISDDDGAAVTFAGHRLAVPESVVRVLLHGDRLPACLALLPSRFSPARRLAAGTFGTYPGEQGRGVFQPISRIVAYGRKARPSLFPAAGKTAAAGGLA